MQYIFIIYLTILHELYYQIYLNDTSGDTSKSEVYNVTFPQTLFFHDFFFPDYSFLNSRCCSLISFMKSFRQITPHWSSISLCRSSETLSLSPSSIFLSLNYQSLSFGPNHPSFSRRPVKLIRFTALPREEVKYFLSLQVQKARLLNRPTQPRNPSTGDTRLTNTIFHLSWILTVQTFMGVYHQYVFRKHRFIKTLLYPDQTPCWLGLVVGVGFTDMDQSGSSLPSLQTNPKSKSHLKHLKLIIIL